MPPIANGRTAGSVESGHEETSRKARAAAASLGPSHVTVIEARRGWRLVDWRELVAYRDLFRFLVWREVRVRYAQSVIGIGWAVIQPVFSMLIFTVVFGRLAAVPSDGVPYALFSLAAMVPWTFFSNALVEGANSLVGNATILSKVYFPRMLMPVSAVVAKLVDFGIALVILSGAMIVYGAAPNMSVLALPVVMLLMVVAAAGLSMWLAALALQYRDVKHAMNFVVQVLMYCTPVVYPTSLIPTAYVLGGVTINPRLLFALNPMVGVIEGFRSALLGTSAFPWNLVGMGWLSAALVGVSGTLYFRSRERVFADVA
jgi:lipopolysaccharide transport system permease protein